MTSNLYDAHIDSQMGKETDLEGVVVTVSFPAPTVSQGLGGQVNVVKRAGTLSIKTAEFPGWYSAELISLTHKETGDQTLYEVTRNFSYPHVDGEWVTFPVLNRG